MARDDPRPSLLPFDPADLVAIRVSPAQFARMVGVSKQSVSRWIKLGIVTLGPDGKFDPSVATRHVIERSDPARMRARIFKSALSSHRELLEKNKELEQEIIRLREVEKIIVSVLIHPDTIAENISSLIDLVISDFQALVDAYRDGELESMLDSITAGIFYPQSKLEIEFESDEAPTAPSADSNLTEKNKEIL